MDAVKVFTLTCGWLWALSSLTFAAEGADQLHPIGPGGLTAVPRTANHDSTNEVLWRGIDAMYSYRFATAEVALDSVMAVNPYNSVAPFVAVANHWLKSLTEQGYQASHEALLQALDATLPKYEAMIARFGQRR